MQFKFNKQRLLFAIKSFQEISDFEEIEKEIEKSSYHCCTVVFIAFNMT